jgi:hypothetical protein
MPRMRSITSVFAAIVFSATSAAAAKLVFTTHEPADAFVYAWTWKPWAEKVVADSSGAIDIDNRPSVAAIRSPKVFASKFPCS